jgi:hypothetical protein
MWACAFYAEIGRNGGPLDRAGEAGREDQPKSK